MTHYIKSKKFCESKHDQGLIILSVIITFFVLVSLSFYLFQTNSLVGCNFKIRNQQTKIKQLEVKAEKMEMSIAQWQSPANLEGLVDSLKMIEIGEVTYLGIEKEMAVYEGK